MALQLAANQKTAHSDMPHDPEALQKLEHEERMVRELLKQSLADEHRVLMEQGILRTRLQRIENDKYRLLTGRRT